MFFDSFWQFSPFLCQKSDGSDLLFFTSKSLFRSQKISDSLQKRIIEFPTLIFPSCYILLNKEDNFLPIGKGRTGQKKIDPAVGLVGQRKFTQLLVGLGKGNWPNGRAGWAKNIDPAVGGVAKDWPSCWRGCEKKWDPAVGGVAKDWPSCWRGWAIK